jgi:hypothetical protein
MYRSTFDKILNDFYKTNILNEAGRSTSNQNPESNNSSELIDLDIEDVLKRFGIDKIFDEVKDSGFLSERFDKHLNKFLQSYGAGSEVVPAVYKIIYFLSGFEEDTNKVYKTYQGLSSSSFGDPIDDGNNSYFCYWFAKFLNKIEEIQHKTRAKDPINDIVSELEKLNPKKLKLYQVIIFRLFLRRLKTFVSKKYVKKRFLDLKKYPKDELYEKILHDVGLSLFEYLDMSKKFYDKGAYDVGANKEQKLKAMSLNAMGEEYSAFLSLIDDKAREAIAQMLANNETNEANPTIPGNMHDRAAVDVLEKFRSDENIDIKHSYSTMATTPDGKLLIGSLFFDEEFNGGKLEPSAQEFEYFKTIVAHEALHQIFFAFDDNEIISFLSEKYAAIAKNSAYRGLFHTAANIIQDCFLNGMLEDWHFKIKPEWYEKFYFPKQGLRTFKYKILSEGLDILRNDPDLEIYAKYERNGEITIGMASTMTTREFPRHVISFENESECVAFLFVLMYEDMMFNSKNPSKPPEPDLKDSPPPQGPPSPPQGPPPDSPPQPQEDSVSVGEICRLPDGTYGKVSNVDSDGTFDVTPISKNEVDQYLGESRIRRSDIVLLEGKYKIDDVTFITKNPPEGQEPPPPSDQQQGKKKTEPKDKPKDKPQDKSEGKSEDSRPDDMSKPPSSGSGEKPDDADAERQRVQDYLNQMEKDNGKIMDSESHPTEPLSEDEGEEGKDPSEEGGQSDGGKKRSETSEERKGKKFKFTPYHIKNNTYKNVLKDFLAKSFKYKKTYEDTDIDRVASYNAGGAAIKDEKMVPEKADPTIDSIVIAIDTSGSISADMCRSFLNQAYTILRNQAKEMKLITPSGALAPGVKEKDLFSCIPIFWNDKAYFPQLSRDKIEDIKLNCVNFNTKIGNIMQYFDTGGTTFSSVVPKYNEIQKALGTKKIAGVIYFTDMELYESPVKLPATPAVKIISIVDPRSQTYIYNRLKFEIPPKTKFNPYGGDIIYDPELKPASAKKNFQESVNKSFENNFKINGRLYKDL